MRMMIKRASCTAPGDIHRAWDRYEAIRQSQTVSRSAALTWRVWRHRGAHASPTVKSIVKTDPDRLSIAK